MISNNPESVRSANGENPIKVYFYGKPQNQLQRATIEGLNSYMQKQGVDIQDKPTKETKLIITPVEMDRDIPVQNLVLLRHGKDVERYQVKVISIATLDSIPNDISEIDPEHLGRVLDTPNRNPRDLVDLARSRGLSPVIARAYPQIPRAGCTSALIIGGDENSRNIESAYLIGLEQSHPRIDTNGGFYADLYGKLEKQARAEMVIANKESREVVLPWDVWLRSTSPQEIIKAGQQMRELGMYPPQFPYGSFIGEIKKQFYKRFLELTGLSFGNTSKRAEGEEAQYGKFWMSKSGAKKDALEPTEVYLAAGLMDGTSTMERIPVEGLNQSGRMSVDAIESKYIYDAFGEVSVTAHGHFWLKDPKTNRPVEQFSGCREIAGTLVVCTEEQYSCGSKDLGRVTVDAISQSPDPSRTSVLQKRHGVNSLGKNYKEMFERIKTLRDKDLMTLEIPQD